MNRKTKQKIYKFKKWTVKQILKKQTNSSRGTVSEDRSTRLLYLEQHLDEKLSRLHKVLHHSLIWI